MRQNVNDATAKVEVVRKILSDYIWNSGFINTSMQQLQDDFAKVLSPKAPYFHYHFSTFARTAIAEDIRRGRTAYPIGGYIPADYDCMVGEPIILPGKAIFQDSKDVFHRALGKDWEESSSSIRGKNTQSSSNIIEDFSGSTLDSKTNPSDFVQADNPAPTLSEVKVQLGHTSDKGKASLGHIHPRSSPLPTHSAFARHVEFVDKAAARRGHSGTPPGSPPSSPNRTSIKTSDCTQTATTHAQRRSSPSPSNSSYKRYSRTVRDSLFPIRKEPAISQPSSSSKRRTQSSSSESHHSRRRNYCTSSRIVRSPSEALDSSSSSSRGFRREVLIPQPQLNFVAKVKQQYNFQTKAKGPGLENYSRGARKLQAEVVQHLSDIKQAVNAFNTCGVKPANFPNELSRDLLSYNFIDIEIIYAHNLARKSKHTSYDSDDKINTSSKIKPVPVNHFGHWLKIINTLRDAYIAAFPVVANYFLDYFEDLLSLTKGFSEPAE